MSKKVVIPDMGRPELDETCVQQVNIETRQIYQAGNICQPKVKAKNDVKPTGTSNDTCNLTELKASGYYTALHIDSRDQGLTFSGCGSAQNPLLPKLDYTFIKSQIIPNSFGADFNKYGWNVVTGIVQSVGKFVPAIVEKDSSIQLTTNPDGSIAIGVRKTAATSIGAVQYVRPVVLICATYTAIGMAWVVKIGSNFFVKTAINNSPTLAAKITGDSGPFATIEDAINSAESVSTSGCVTPP